MAEMKKLRITSMIARAGSQACAVSGQCQYQISCSEPGEKQPRCNQEPEVKTVEHSIIFSVKHFQSPSRNKVALTAVISNGTSCAKLQNTWK